MRYWNISGYRPKTNFYDQFSFRDDMKDYANENLFCRLFKTCTDNSVMLTELMLVIECKRQEHLSQGNEEAADRYKKLYWAYYHKVRARVPFYNLNYFLKTLAQYQRV